MKPSNRVPRKGERSSSGTELMPKRKEASPESPQYTLGDLMSRFPEFSKYEGTRTISQVDSRICSHSLMVGTETPRGAARSVLFRNALSPAEGHLRVFRECNAYENSK